MTRSRTTGARTPRAEGRSLTLRLTLRNPPAGVPWAVQLGREDLLRPTTVTPDRVVFDVTVELVSSPAGPLRLRGAAVQGPAGARFLYVNSGTRAGALGSRWDRRAKVPLTGIALEPLHATPASQPLILYGEIAGTAKDGGPACASVPLLNAGWASRG